MTLMEEAIQAGKIQNKVLGDITWDLNHITSDMFFLSEAPFYHRDLWFTSASLAGARIKEAQKRLKREEDEAEKRSLNRFIAAAREIEHLYAQLKRFKTDGMVVKRVVKEKMEEEKGEHYVPPVPSTKAGKMCGDLLTKMTTGLVGDLTARLEHEYTALVEKHLRSDGTLYGVNVSPMALPIIAMVCNSVRVIDGVQMWMNLKPNWRDLVSEQAHKTSRLRPPVVHLPECDEDCAGAGGEGEEGC